MIIAVFASSLIFGMVHIVNLLSNNTLVIATSVQIIYATFAGIFFAVLYLKTKNIWLIALLHGVTDIISDVGVELAKMPVGDGEITLARGGLMLLIMCPLAIWGIVKLTNPISCNIIRGDYTKNYDGDSKNLRKTQVNLR